MASSINATSTGSGGIIQTADATGVLNIQTNETTAITVGSTQNVGIGTSSPAYKLDVQTAAGRFQVRDLGGSSLKLINSTTGGNIGIDSAGGITLIYANGTETARFDASGNLGIGTSSFSDILTLAGGSSGSYGLTINNAKEGGGTKAIFQYDRDNALAVVGANTTNGLVFKTLTSGSLTTKATLDSSGNLGLGVTPSASSACVNMEFGSYGATLSARNTSSAPQFAISSNAVGNWYAPTYKINGKAAMYLAQGNDGTHSWYTAGTGTAGNAITFTQAMTLDASSNLDIVGNFTLQNRGALRSSTNGAIQVSADTTNTYANSYIMFDVDGSERARIDSSGNLCIGTTSNNGARVASDAGTSNAYWGRTTSTGVAVGVWWNSATSGDNQFQLFYTDSAPNLRGSITYNRGGGLVAYNTTSDYRAKTVNGLVQNALAKIAALKPSTGRMNGAEYDIDFFVAHELQEVVPSAVTGEKDAIKEDGTPDYQMVDKSALIPLLTAAIQELKAEFDAYKSTHP